MNALLHNEPLNKAMKLLPSWITAILVVVLAIMLASFVWLIVTPPSGVLFPSTTGDEPVIKAEPIKDYGKIVADFHLFGQEKKAAPSNKKPEKTPVTRLNLELYGIVARPGRESYAIIAEGKQGEQKIYSEDQSPQAGVVIEEIQAKKVILRHSGKLEELLLPEKKLASGSSARRPSNARGNNNLPSEAPLPSAVSDDQLPDDQLPEDDLGALRDVLTNEPDKILQIVSISETKDKDGNLLGFRLSPGKNRKLFRKLGLRPGDIATQINGIVLDSAAKGIMVMNELSGAASISITVKRGDQEITIDKNL